MNKMKRFLIVILLVFLMATTVFSASSNTIPDSKYILEKTAIDYVQSYINSTYLYASNDLSAGTIKENLQLSGIVLAENLPSEIQSKQFTCDGISVSAAMLCERISSVEAAADYLRYIRSSQGFMRYDFKAEISVVDTNIENDYASVDLYATVSFRYSPDSDLSLCGDRYTVSFIYSNNQWLIADLQAEELEAFGLMDAAKTYEARIEEFDKLQLKKSLATPLVSYANYATAAYSRTYNRSNAIAYAYTYTTSSYNNTPGTGNNSSFINANFNNYTGMGGNCQNFASQCVWAGFGGVNTVDAVNSHQFPMNSAWYDTKSNGLHTASWTCTDDFYSYITSSNSNIATTIGNVNGSFAYIPLYLLNGAVLHVNPNAGGYAHAVIITNATGSSYSSIEICGNSPMRKGVILSDQAYSSNMRVIMPTSATGENISLNITGAMLKPIPVGSTHTLSATANQTCYRIAICVKHENTQTGIWTEYLNTSQISKVQTFSQTGLYTVTVRARAVNSSTSTVAEHIYTVRVY